MAAMDADTAFSKSLASHGPKKERQLLTWAYEELLKSGYKKRVGTNVPRTDARYWALLEALLRGSLDAMSMSLLKPALMKTFAGAIDDLAAGPIDASGALLERMHQVFSLLVSKYSIVFRPGLEDSIAVLTGLIRVEAQLANDTTAVRSWLVDALRAFASLASAQPNQRRVFAAVVATLLESLLGLRATLDLQSDSALVAAVDNVLSVVLFHPDHIGDYNMAFSRATSGLEMEVGSEEEHQEGDGEQRPVKKRKIGRTASKAYKGSSIKSFQSAVFDRLRELTEPARHEDQRVPIYGSLPRMLSLFIAAHRARVGADIEARATVGKKRKLTGASASADATAEFNFYLELHSLLARASGEASSAADPVVIRASTALLRVLHVSEVYRAGEDGTAPMLAFFRQQAERLVEVAQEDAACGAALEGLGVLLDINHHAIETVLPTLLSRLLALLGVEGASHEAMSLMLTFVNTYAKLRQLPPFLGELCEALKHAASVGRATRTLLDRISAHIRVLMPGPQLDECWRIVAEAAADRSLSEEKADFVSELAAAFFASMRVVQSSAAQLEQQAAELARSLIGPELKRMRDGKTPKHPRHCMLLLFLALRRLAQRCDDELRPGALASAPPEFFSLAGVEDSVLAVFRVDESAKEPLVAFSPKLRYCVAVVLLERLRELHSRLVAVGSKSEDSDSLRQEAAATARVVWAATKGKVNASATWESSVGSLDDETVRVAVWELVTRNITILSSYASGSHLRKFVERLLRTSTDGAADGALTSGSLNARTLSSSTLYELHPLRDVIVSYLVAELAAVARVALYDHPLFAAIEAAEALSDDDLAAARAALGEQFSAASGPATASGDADSVASLRRLLDAVRRFPSGYLPTPGIARLIPCLVAVDRVAWSTVGGAWEEESAGACADLITECRALLAKLAEASPAALCMRLPVSGLLWLLSSPTSRLGPSGGRLQALRENARLLARSVACHLVDTDGAEGATSLEGVLDAIVPLLSSSSAKKNTVVATAAGASDVLSSVAAVCAERMLRAKKRVAKSTGEAAVPRVPARVAPAMQRIDSTLAAALGKVLPSSAVSFLPSAPTTKSKTVGSVAESAKDSTGWAWTGPLADSVEEGLDDAWVLNVANAASEKAGGGTGKHVAALLGVAAAVLDFRRAAKDAASCSSSAAYMPACFAAAVSVLLSTADPESKAAAAVFFDACCRGLDLLSPPVTAAVLAAPIKASDAAAKKRKAIAEVAEAEGPATDAQPRSVFVVTFAVALRLLASNEQSLKSSSGTAFSGLLRAARGREFTAALKLLCRELESTWRPNALSAAVEAAGVIASETHTWKGQRGFRRHVVPLALALQSALLRAADVWPVPVAAAMNGTTASQANKNLAPVLSGEATRVILLVLEAVSRLLSSEEAVSLGSRDVALLLNTPTPVFQLSSHKLEGRAPSGTLLFPSVSLPDDLAGALFRLLYMGIKHRPKETRATIATLLSHLRSLLLAAVQPRPDADAGAARRAGAEVSAVQARNVARLYQELSSHPASCRKYAPYVLADYVTLINAYTIAPASKRLFLPGVYALMDTCSEHEFAQLHRVLPEAHAESFKALHADYARDHKYQGKV